MTAHHAIVNNSQLIVDGRPFYLRGAEIHYFRLPRSEWRNRLQQAKDGGMNTISSYMPWYWHEPQEGQLDVDGHTAPERDLDGFLAMCGELGLKVIARPGPFVNSELRLGGFPEWLFREHPETLSHRSDGRIATGRPLPAEGETVYRDYVRQWYRDVNTVIAKHDIHNGGPVILFQPDNELSAAWSYGLLNSLYDPETLSQRWPAWLTGKYRELALLNKAYGTHYETFSVVEPPRAFPASVAEKRRCVDWLDFKRFFFADWGATMAHWAGADGVRVPILFNEPVAGYYGHGDHAGSGAVMKARGIQGMTACHTYSDRIMDLEGIQGSLMGIELVKSSPWGGPPMSVEVNAGWYIPRMGRSEINWNTLMRLGLGHGLMGSVIYPYAAALVSHEDVIDGPEYWEPSCVDLQGNPTAAYARLKQFNAFISGWECELTAASTPSDITLAYSPGQRLLDFLGAPTLDGAPVQAQAAPGGERFDAEPVLDRSATVGSHDWLDGYEGVSKQTISAESGVWKRNKEIALLFTRMNLAFDMLDLTHPARKPGEGWLVVACTGALEKRAIDYLLDHLDQGGGCLFTPTIPVSDLDGTPDDRLAKRLAVSLQGKTPPAGGRLLDYGSRIVETEGGKPLPVLSWLLEHAFPEGSDVLATFENRPVAAKLPDAVGKVAVVGFDPFFTTLASLNFWRNVTQRSLGITPAIVTEGQYDHACLRRGEETSILTVINVGGASGPGIITVRDLVPGIPELRLELDLALHEARCLLLNADLRCIRMFYTTSEMIPLSEDRVSFRLHGHAGTRGEMAFDRPIEGLLNRVPVKSTPANGVHLISYHHAIEPTLFTITNV